MRQSTITINGRVYDALSGSPVQSQATAVAPKPSQPVVAKPVSDVVAARPAAKSHAHEQPANSIHDNPQKAKTLNRQALKKPVNAHHVAAGGLKAHHSAHTGTRSPLISRFKQTVVNPAPSRVEPSTEPMANTTPLHPSVVAALQNKQSSSQSEPPKSSKELKEALIKERLAEVGSSEPTKKPGLFARKPRLASILVSSLSLLLLGGYFTYINLTNISMRVAASNAGINASFPGYKPDGYSLNGPITYAPGEVNINYKSNTSDNNFTLTQKSSTWDSQGVLDNYVRKQTSTYLTFQQRGVTVYTFNNKAAWTNGGLLYTIEGDASLSSDQILKLATSL